MPTPNFTSYLEKFSPYMDREDFREFSLHMEADLVPAGIMEICLAIEIIHARWRLADYLKIDPASLDQTAQLELEKCRTRTANMVRRDMVELRREQSERQIREQLGTNLTGLASSRELVEVARAVRRSAPSNVESHEVADIEEKIHTKLQNEVENTKRSQSTGQGTPRNAPCPCKSGEKYKRCCGKSAPPLLSQAA